MKKIIPIIIIVVFASCNNPSSFLGIHGIERYDTASVSFLTKNIERGLNINTSMSGRQTTDFIYPIEKYNHITITKMLSKAGIESFNERYKDQILAKYNMDNYSLYLDSCLGPFDVDLSLYSALNYSIEEYQNYIRKNNIDSCLKLNSYPLPKFVYEGKFHETFIMNAEPGIFSNDSLTGIEAFPNEWNNGYLTGYSIDSIQRIIKLWYVVW